VQISSSFYEVVAALIPVLLIALAVEQFAIVDDDDKTPASFSLALWTIAALTVAESVALGAVAHGSSSQLADYTMIAGLSLGWVLLVVSYLFKLVQAMPENRRWSGAWVAMIVAPGIVAIACPVVALLVYLVAAAN
jgi:hypothetical protein